MALITISDLEPEIGLITLNDPDNLNAMGEEMAKECRELVTVLKGKKPGYRALILTGAGRAFSAGGNLEMLKEKSNLSGEENRLRMLKFYDSFLSLLSLDIPIIAAINGHAIGAGLCVASACDIRIAAEGSKLGFTFAKLGLHPGMGATFFLPRVVGVARANELLLTGRVVMAEEALAMGLVSKVCKASDIVDQAKIIAHEILGCGPECIRQLLQSLRKNSTTLAAALEREALCQSINYASSEFKEGVQSVIEKRAAKF
ncbi:MAG: enoyl-CoA hydratase/isomerase family protein [Bdellovibrionales bacterium]|nr:enoyl-CoA hydratase/isomerase family protein [Bdellovibrionales bacterium]